jgi:hypothetical protein
VLAAFVLEFRSGDAEGWVGVGRQELPFGAAQAEEVAQAVDFLADARLAHRAEPDGDVVRDLGAGDVGEQAGEVRLQVAGDAALALVAARVSQARLLVSEEAVAGVGEAGRAGRQLAGLELLPPLLHLFPALVPQVLGLFEAGGGQFPDPLAAFVDEADFVSSAVLAPVRSAASSPRFRHFVSPS